MAATSSVISIPTGHQVMQRPQPTHPEDPNWSNQVASLRVIHCRYLDLVVLRTGTPCKPEKSMVKHESQRRDLVAETPSRVTVSSVVEQKQVGQTSVQLVQARHLCATSSQRGCSRLARRSSLIPSVSIVLPMLEAVFSTIRSTVVASASVASRPGSIDKTRWPDSLPASKTNS